MSHQPRSNYNKTLAHQLDEIIAIKKQYRLEREALVTLTKEKDPRVSNYAKLELCHTRRTYLNELVNRL